MDCSNSKSNETKVKIVVCYHQPWLLPKERIFFPIQSGKAISVFNLKMQGDDIGDSISSKNETFSEFTAWYWAWKNIKTIYPNIEYIGLAHYRRFFALDEPLERYTEIIVPGIPKMENYEDLIVQKLENNDIILVKPASFGCDLQNQWNYWHHVDDLITMKNIIHEMCPEYDETFRHFFKGNNKISLYCMFIGRCDFFNRYFEWLFPLLFEAEKRINIFGYDPWQKRVLAFLAERLLNIYVIHNKLKVRYEPIYFIKEERFMATRAQVKMKPIAKMKARIRKVIKFITPYGIVRWRNMKMFEKDKHYRF
jgi:hypothetical protein